MKCLYYLASSLAVIVIQATQVQAQLAPPSKLVAIPNYGTTSIELKWKDNSSNENGFEVFRADGGPFVSYGNTTANMTTFEDTAVSNASEYVYLVRAFNAAGTSAFSNSLAQNIKVLWPVPASHEVLHNWNETIGDAAVYYLGSTLVASGFHRGVDIQRTGSNNDAVAARGGVVAAVLDGPDGYVVVKVKVGPMKFEFDQMNHLGAGVTVRKNDIVRAGKKCGQIDESGIWEFLGAVAHFVDHTHFDQALSPGGRVVERHPLLMFAEDADRDPQETEPAFMDHAGSPAGVLMFRRQGAAVGSYLSFDETHPLSGDIDILAEVVDTMGTNPEQIPVALGYWIESQAATTCSAQSPGVKWDFEPYVLFDFSHSYFGTGQSNLNLSKRIADEGQDYGPMIVDGTEQYFWPHYYHFILTNAKGTTGVVADVDARQCWNTNAKDDGEAFNHPRANYAGKPDTKKATEARFPDGIYTIHVMASDLVHLNVDLPQDVRIENFPPFVCHAQPTGELLAGETSTECAIAFSEPMDTTNDLNTLIEIDGGAVISSAQWISDVLMTFDATGLMDGTTYTVTLDKGAKDKPGTPGGRKLDGNQDGVPGDDYLFSFTTQDGTPSPAMYTAAMSGNPNGGCTACPGITNTITKEGPIEYAPDSCMVGESTFRGKVIAESGKLYVEAAIDWSPGPGEPCGDLSAFAKCAIDDLVFTGPVGAPPPIVSVTMEVEAKNMPNNGTGIWVASGGLAGTIDFDCVGCSGVSCCGLDQSTVLITSSAGPVPLNVPQTFYYDLSTRVLALNGAPSPEAKVFLRFACSTVFNLPPGYTANSISAGIVDNHLLTPPPSISFVMPSEGSEFTPVFIFGSSFTDVTGTLFNGVESGVVVQLSDGLLFAIAPASTTGPITVTTKCDQATSSGNFVYH